MRHERMTVCKTVRNEPWVTASHKGGNGIIGVMAASSFYVSGHSLKRVLRLFPVNFAKPVAVAALLDPLREFVFAARDFIVNRADAKELPSSGFLIEPVPVCRTEV